MRIRISYVKGTDIRFTSALDMHAIWERSFRRAGIKILYTQGFRPKPRIQLGLPLPLGFISKNEIVDLWVEDSKILLNDFSEILSSCLPMGIEINSIKEIALSEKPLVSQIQSSTYQTHFYDKSISRQILNKEVEKILNATEILGLNATENDIIYGL